MDEPIAGLALLRRLRRWQPNLEDRPPATETELKAAEVRLGFRLPIELRSFLSASNGASSGVELSSGAILPEAISLVWPIDRIVREHGPEATMAGPRSFLFFADAGADLILFGHPISATRVEPEVISWHPIGQEVWPAGDSFEAWLEGWAAGTIRV